MAITVSNKVWQSGTLSNNRAICSPSIAEFKFRINRVIGQVPDFIIECCYSTWVNSGYSDDIAFGFPIDNKYSYPNVHGIPMHGTWYAMDWNTGLSSKVGNCFIRFEAAGVNLDITIKLYFLAAYDIKSVWDNITYDNDVKLLKDSISSFSLLNNSEDPSDVYSTTNKNLKLSIRIKETTTSDEIVFSEFLNNRLRFYNREIANAAPTYLEHVGVLLQQGGNDVTSIDNNLETTVRLRVKALPLLVSCPTWVSTTQVFCFLIRTDTSNNLATMISSYDISYIEVPTLTTPLPTEFDLTNSVFAAPSTPITNYSGTNYECTITIPANTLTGGATYRIIHLWRITNNCITPTELYPNPTNQHDFSFISSEFEVAGELGGDCDLDVVHYPMFIYDAIESYTAAYKDYVSVAANQKLQTRFIIDFTEYNNDTSRKNINDTKVTINTKIYRVDGATKHYFYNETLEYNGGLFTQTKTNYYQYNISFNTLTFAFIFYALSDTVAPNLYSEVGTTTVGALTKNTMVGYDVEIVTTITVFQDGYEDIFIKNKRVKVRNFDNSLSLVFKDSSNNNIAFLCNEIQNVKVCATHNNALQLTQNKTYTNVFVFQKEQGLHSVSDKSEETLAPKNNFNNMQLSDVPSAVNDSSIFNIANNTSCSNISNFNPNNENNTKFITIRKGYGMALNLSNTNLEHVVIPHIPQYLWGCEERTFEAWVMFKSLPASGYNYPIFRKERVGEAGDNNTPLIAMSLNSSGNIFIYINLSQSGGWWMLGQHPTILSPNNWYHVVWVKPTNAYKVADHQIYINGAYAPLIPLYDSLTSGQCHLTIRHNPAGVPNPTFTNDGAIVLGADFDCGQIKETYFTDSNFKTSDMVLGQFSIYDIALTGSDVSTQFQKGRGGIPHYMDKLNLHLRFNSESGNFICDYSNLQNHATIPAYNEYDIPVIGNCNSTLKRSFGVTSTRLAKGGGLWVVK